MAKCDKYISFQKYIYIYIYIYSTDLVLHMAKQDRNILHIIKRRKASCIGHIFHRNCLLKHVIEGEIVGRIKVARRRRHLLDALKEKNDTVK